MCLSIEQAAVKPWVSCIEQLVHLLSERHLPVPLHAMPPQNACGPALIEQPRWVSFYVMTVGSERPVNSASFETSIAMVASGLQTSIAFAKSSPPGATYFSRYMRTVAPATPVPDKRKTKREPPSRKKRIPWFFDTDPSTGSLYSNMSAFSIFIPPNV